MTHTVDIFLQRLVVSERDTLCETLVQADIPEAVLHAVFRLLRSMKQTSQDTALNILGMVGILTDAPDAVFHEFLDTGRDIHFFLFFLKVGSTILLTVGIYSPTFYDCRKLLKPQCFCFSKYSNIGMSEA